MRQHDHPPDTITTALATGTTTLEGAQVDASGAGPDATSTPADPHAGHAHAGGRGHSHPHKKKEGCWSQWKKLLGLDTFIATALHGSKADEVIARRRRNLFSKGLITNCSDFWCDAGGWKHLLSKREDGTAMLGGKEVDYRGLYEVPGGGEGGAMRYRSGGYESVADEEV